MTFSGSTTLPTTTRRILGLCGVIVLVDTLFYAVLSPLLPAYAEQAGITPGQTGLLVAAYPLGTVFGALPAGVLASRRGPRVAVAMGMSVTMVTSLLFAAATTTPELIGFRFLQGIGGALSWTGAMVWVSAVSPSHRRGELLGTLLGLSVVGGVLGPAVGALASITSPALVFRGIAALCLGLVLLTLLASGSDASPTQRVGWRQTLPQLRDRRILLGLWLTAYAGSAFGVINASAPLALSVRGCSNRGGR